MLTVTQQQTRPTQLLNSDLETLHQPIEPEQFNNVEVATRHLLLMQVCASIISSSYKSQLQTLNEENRHILQSTQFEMNVLKHDLIKANQEAAKLEREKHIIQRMTDENEESIRELSKSVINLEASRKDLEHDKTQLQEDLFQLQSTMKNRQEHIDCLTRAADDLKTELSIVKRTSESDMAENLIHIKALEETNIDISTTMKGKVEQMERQYSILRQQEKDTENENKVLQEHARSHERTIKSYETSLKALQQDLRALSIENHGIEQKSCDTNNEKIHVIQEHTSGTQRLQDLDIHLQHVKIQHKLSLEQAQRNEQQMLEVQQKLKEENESLKEQLAQQINENSLLQAENKHFLSSTHLHNKINTKNTFELQSKLDGALQTRKRLFDEIQDMRGNVRVFCRIRPPTSKQPARPFLSIPTSTTGNNWTVVCKEEHFSFDRVFQPDASNTEVYNETAGVVEMLFNGSNVCILAYGQTGSGKTHTMQGRPNDPGVNLRAVKDIFSLLETKKTSAQVYISAIEIYNDEIRDLLCTRKMGKFVETTGYPDRKQDKLEIRNVSSIRNDVHVPGLTKSLVRSFQEVLRTVSLAQGRRSTHGTSMNASSSRSHSIVEIEVRQGEVRTKLHMVDLAGSERIDRSKVCGQRLVETKHINKSLAALGNVFYALEKKNAHIPYRDTKLTHFLKNSIGGNAKTLMFITLSDDVKDKYETTATLEFGKRVGKIILNEAYSEQTIDKLRILDLQLRDADDNIRKIKTLIDL